MLIVVMFTDLDYVCPVSSLNQDVFSARKLR